MKNHHRNRFLLSLFALVLAVRLAADTPANSASPVPPASAKEELAGLAPSFGGAMGFSPDFKGKSPQQQIELLDNSRRAIVAKLEALFLRWPQDPDRWQAVIYMNQLTPIFITSFPPDFDPPKNGLTGVVFDQAAKSAFETKLASYKKALTEAADAPEICKIEIATDDLGRVMTLEAKKPAPDLPGLRGQLEAYFAKWPNSPFQDRVLKAYLDIVGKVSPDGIEPEWERLAHVSNETLAKIAAKHVKATALLKETVDLQFTAVDGRPVDLAKLHGKVVLVDFWATWCGPCKAEIPNVKQVYAAYHDKGFEVVGVALESARLDPNDTADQAAAKLAKARQKLVDFTAKEQMPWPQYFDGKHWNNDISTRYDIKSIPAMFLIDQAGKIVSTDARGPALETEVKRLLKL